MIHIQKKLWLLIVPIVLLASVIRLYRLDSVPPSPYWEEVALGYDAYSIAMTGKDHHGNSYPLIAFPSYGDYKPSGYFYAIVPFVKVLGLSIWAVRLPSAIAGIISVALLYLLGREVFDEKVGLLAALLLTIQPWAIQFSRGGWEVNFATMLILTGAWLLFHARKKPLLLPLSVLFFSLSMYTYHAARLFAPMVGGLGGVFILYSWVKTTTWSTRASRPKIISIFLSMVLLFGFLFPLLSNLKNKEVSSRFSDTSIFSNPQPVLDSNAAIAAHGGSRVAKLFYHRYWYYGVIVIKQWASHFTPTFLFLRGDGNYRHGGWTGLLYPAEAVTEGIALIVVFCSFRKRSRINYQLGMTLIWIVLAAVAPALVTPAPHALRFLFAAPALSLLSAFGLVALYEATPVRLQKISAFLIFCVFLFSFSSYFSQYLYVYPVKAASDWQYGYKQLYQSVAELKKPGEQVFVSREFGRPSMYYLFYSSYDPAHLQSIEANLPKDQLELLQVDEYHFVDGIPNETGLYALGASKIVVGGKIVKNIEDPEGHIVWTLWRK